MVLHGDSRSILGVNIALPILATVAVGLRVLARRRKQLPLKSDDYTIIIALILSIGVCMGGIYAVSAHIIGPSLATMTQARYEAFEKVLFVDVLLCHLIYGVIKISVLLFYRRIFTTPRFRLCANVLLAMVVAWMIAAFAAHLSASNPVSKFWDHPLVSEESSNVYDYPAFLIAMSSIDLIFDLVILSLPLPVIKNLHLSLRRKWTLAGIFMLGFFCVISSAVRLYYVDKNLSRFIVSIDKRTYYSNSTDIWGHIEACASVITACLPTLGPLFKDGKSTESLVGSLRSFFSIKSRLVFSVHKRDPEAFSSLDSVEAKKSWHELNMVTTITPPGTANNAAKNHRANLEKNYDNTKYHASQSTETSTSDIEN